MCRGGLWQAVDVVPEGRVLFRVPDSQHSFSCSLIVCVLVALASRSAGRTLRTLQQLNTSFTRASPTGRRVLCAGCAISSRWALFLSPRLLWDIHSVPCCRDARGRPVPPAALRLSSLPSGALGLCCPLHPTPLPRRGGVSVCGAGLEQECWCRGRASEVVQKRCFQCQQRGLQGHPGFFFALIIVGSQPCPFLLF